MYKRQTYDEVVADYMVTYYNYYGVEPGTDKYDAIANSNIKMCIRDRLPAGPDRRVRGGL